MTRSSFRCEIRSRLVPSLPSLVCESVLAMRARKWASSRPEPAGYLLLPALLRTEPASILKGSSRRTTSPLPVRRRRRAQSRADIQGMCATEVYFHPGTDMGQVWRNRRAVGTTPIHDAARHRAAVVTPPVLDTVIAPSAISRCFPSDTRSSRTFRHVHASRVRPMFAPTPTPPPPPPPPPNPPTPPPTPRPPPPPPPPTPAPPPTPPHPPPPPPTPPPPRGGGGGWGPHPPHPHPPHPPHPPPPPSTPPRAGDVPPARVRAGISGHRGECRPVVTSRPWNHARSGDEHFTRDPWFPQGESCASATALCW